MLRLVRAQLGSTLAGGGVWGSPLPRRLAGIKLLAAWLALGGVAAAGAGEKRLIYYGWGAPDTSYVAAHRRDIDDAPFDGTGIVIAIDRDAWDRGQTGTENQLGWHVFGPHAWRRTEFADAAADLQAAESPHPRHDFLAVVISSHGQDDGFSWFDDARWKVALRNWAVLVSIARAGGCRGLLLDPEHYGASFFNYAWMRPRADADLPSYLAQVRRRGREIMRVTRTLFPDLTILLLFGHSIATHDRSYDLYPAFLDGMLEAAPPSARIVDGYEPAYGFRTGAEFAAARLEIRSAGRRLSAVPELYRRHVEVGFGLWLDHGGQRHWSAIDLERNYFSPAGFAAALGRALAASDGYVWVYSQAPGRFPSDLPRAYLDAVRRARAG